MCSSRSLPVHLWMMIFTCQRWRLAKGLGWPELAHVYRLAQRLSLTNGPSAFWNRKWYGMCNSWLFVLPIYRFKSIESPGAEFNEFYPLLWNIPASDPTYGIHFYRFIRCPASGDIMTYILKVHLIKWYIYTMSWCIPSLSLKKRTKHFWHSPEKYE